MLQKLLRQMVRRGRLTVKIKSGSTWTFGELAPDRPDLDVVIGIDGLATAAGIAADPYLRLGEAWMDGKLTVENGDLWSLMELIGVNIVNLPDRSRSSWHSLLHRFSRLLPAHSLRASRRNVAHHYDLSERLYRLFLDEDMQYSCAYFQRPGMSLEQAQIAKKDHIAAKLFLKPGQTVLDIGCGWGGMALHLARRERVKVTGITLSTEQIMVAIDRAKAVDVSGRVRFDLCDYREATGKFDRVVSVGMFEHVGLAGFDGYFRTIAERLKDDGVAVIHTIGRRGATGGRSKWLDKYIFPGGYIPSLSEITRAAERSGLWVTDVEMLRLHYADTLRAWRERFQSNREEICALYDERFCRMWEFYLCWCELGFRYSNLMVFQLQLAKSIDALPTNRDYMMQPPVASAADSASVVDFRAAAGKLRDGTRRTAQALRHD